MSRVSHLEQDMVSEQKHFFGFTSYRQAVYLLVGALVLYSFVPYVYKFGSMLGGIIAGVICGIFFSSIICFVIYYVAFTKHPLTNYYRDKHFYIVFNNRHEVGKWRKATNRNLKTFEEMGSEE